MEIPPAFKPLTTYIRRAEELDKDVCNSNASVVAYHCRMYAIDKGMKLGLPQSECEFLFKIMGVIEKSPHTSLSKDIGKTTCEDFALHVFHIADDEDRGAAGATMGTAKTFYSASAYFDILEQFGELEPDVSSMLILYIPSTIVIIFVYIFILLYRSAKSANILSGKQQI